MNILNSIGNALQYLEDKYEIVETLFALYILGPIPYLIYYKFIKKPRQKKKGIKPKIKKFLSIPCLLITAVPGFVIVMIDSEFISADHEDQWAMATLILTLLVTVYTIIQYGLPGIWTGLIRALIGILIGGTFGALLICILGFLLVISFGGGDPGAGSVIYILRDGEKTALFLDSDESADYCRNVYHYSDGIECYTYKGHGYVFDRYGRAFAKVH